MTWSLIGALAALAAVLFLWEHWAVRRCLHKIFVNLDEARLQGSVVTGHFDEYRVRVELHRIIDGRGVRQPFRVVVSRQDVDPLAPPAQA